MKKLDLSRSVHDLCMEYPELLDALNDLGFADISKPGMLNTVGRMMTLPKGARVKRMDLADLQAKLATYGFETVDESSIKGEKE